MHRLSLPALVLALTAMAMPVSAAEGTLNVGSLVHEEPATQSGDLAMLFVLDTTGQPSAPSKPWISGSAAGLRALSYGRTVTEMHLPDNPSPFDTVPLGSENSEAPVETRLGSAQLRLTAAQPMFEVHAFVLDGTIGYTAVTDHRTLKAENGMRMGAQSFGNRDLVGSQATLESPNFASVVRDGPFVYYAGDPTTTEMTLRGSFILEMYGLTLQATSPEGEATLASGEQREPVAGGDGTVADVRRTFIRVFFEGAEITLALDGGNPRVEWAATQLSLESEGAVTLYQSYGRVKSDDEPVLELDGDRFVLPVGHLVAISPTEQGLQVDVSEPEVGTRGTIADVPAPASAALVGSGAVLALLIAVGIGLLRRVLRMPQLAEVERAIEEGEYRRAARLAGRILARRPDDESAVLARGIALSKAGKHERTVRELTAHLARTSATDGSLHYVLGLAQLDLGERDAGRASLREAVRLTPSLQSEVGLRLGKGFSSPAPTTREASAYA